MGTRQVMSAEEIVHRCAVRLQKLSAWSVPSSRDEEIYTLICDLAQEIYKIKLRLDPPNLEFTKKHE